jgi:hypothetical protein
MAKTVKKIILSAKQVLAYNYLMDDVTTEVFFGGSAYSAKSWLGCTWILTQCVKHPEVRYGIARKELKKAKETTLATFFKAARYYGLYDYFKYNEQKGLVSFKGTGSEVKIIEMARKPDDPDYDKFGSLELTGLYIDEIAEVDELAYGVLRTRVGRQNNDEHNILGKVLSASNPTKKWVYRHFYKPYKEGTMPDTMQVILALPKDNEYGDKRYIKNQLEKIKDESTRQRLLLGNWEYDEDSTKLIDYTDILYVFENRLQKGGNHYITADVARFGKDQTVIIYWNGWIAEEIITIARGDLTKAKDEIEELRRRYGVPKGNIVVDSDGLGSGLVDFGGYKGFINNARAIFSGIGDKRDNFANLKSQCFFALADHIRDQDIYINKINLTQKVVSNIIEELEQLRRDRADDDGKVRIQSKKDFMISLGRSPDFADALAMRAYFDLQSIMTGYLL